MKLAGITSASHVRFRKLMSPLDRLLEKDVAKQRISSDDASSARQRLSFTTSSDKLSEVDFVIEAVPVRFSMPSLAV